jgi:DNA end-binding protein Ku
MPSAPRSFWKGHLRLSLVTIPIRLVSAASSEEKIALHQVDRNSKSRIRYQKVAADTGKVVPQEDIVQGYEVEPGQYVLLDDDSLDALKLDTRHTLELTQFVDVCSIDPLYFDRPYYVLPDGDVAEEGYRVIRDALRAAKKYAVGQLTMRGRENLVALKPCGQGLLLETLRYENEIKDADEVFAGIATTQLRPELLDMAKELITARSSEFAPGTFQNHYTKALRELVQSKLKGGEAVAVGGGDDAQPGGTIIDFMDALRRSTGRGETGKGKKAVAAPKSVKISKTGAEVTKDTVKRGTPSKAGPSTAKKRSAKG